jgi:hypothetical protein
MKYTITFFLALILNIVLLAQNEEQIREIDVIRQETDKNLDNYEKEEKVNDSTSNKYVYTLDKELKLITVEVNEQGINKKVRWYFEKGKFIFSEQIWKNISSAKLIDDEKFYVNNNNLVAYFIFEKKVDPASMEYKYVASKLLDGFDLFVEELRK